MNRLFVLGAPDPEMEAIQKVLEEAGEKYVFALKNGYRVTSRTAYEADPIRIEEHCAVVTVECRLTVTTGVGGSVKHIDHHRPGDSGYGKEPKEYWQASSIGQVLALLPSHLTTLDHMYVAAADHCLASAYRGMCPGVEPTKLAEWRAESRSNFQKIPLFEYLEEVKHAKSVLRALPSQKIKSKVFKDARNREIKELPEASAQLGIPVLYSMASANGDWKEGVLSGTPEEVRVWMWWAKNRGSLPLRGVYGDPQRGYAGGFG